MDNKETSNSVNVIAKAASELVDKIPTYQDILQPAAREISKGLLIVAEQSI